MIQSVQNIDEVPGRLYIEYSCNNFLHDQLYIE